MRNENYDDSTFSNDRYDQKRDRFLNQTRQRENRSFDDLYDKDKSFLQSDKPYTNGYNFNNKGKGPKNYKRSDARICEDICEKLSESPYINAENIEVTVENGTVFLSGAVDSKRAKLFVQDIADGTNGVYEIINRIEINQNLDTTTSHNYYQND